MADHSATSSSISSSNSTGPIVPAEVTSCKGTTLKCQLSSGEQGLIQGISFNRKLGRNFRNGDRVEVIVMSQSPLQIALTKDYVKPLLIFDMHGVLGEREPFQKGKPRRFIRRPHCEEFVKYCAERYEIAVWSCAMKKNIDLKIFNSIKLIFVWTQDESTNLYPYMSIVSDHKPLFLKELSSVWKKFPSYDVTNTILLDNHVEKCENNPVGTCVIVPDFELDKHDDKVISIQGEIAQHLHAMVSDISNINLSRYICQRAGTSSLFPTNYQSSGSRRLDPNHSDPIPVRVKNILDQFVKNKSGSGSPVFVSTRESSAISSLSSHVSMHQHPPKKKRNPLLVEVLESVLKKDEPSIDDIFEKHYMLIYPHKRTLYHEDLSKISGDREAFLAYKAVVSSTVFVVVDPTAKLISLLFSDLSVHKLPIPESRENQETYEEWMDDMAGGMTVFIAELHEATASKQYFLSILDVVQLNGKVICDHSSGEGCGCLLLDRIARINGWLFYSPLDDIPLTYNSKPLFIKCKVYTPASDLHELSVVPIDSTTGNVVQPDVTPEESDGVVFIQANVCFKFCLGFEWKPAWMWTVDVSIHLKELAAALLHKRGGTGGGSVNLSVTAVYQNVSSSAEIIVVTVPTSVISSEVTRLLSAGGDSVEDTCLATCRLLRPAFDDNNASGEWGVVAERFYPMSERRFYSVNNMIDMKRAHEEDLSLSHLL